MSHGEPQRSVFTSVRPFPCYCGSCRPSRGWATCPPFEQRRGRPRPHWKGVGYKNDWPTELARNLEHLLVALVFGRKRSLTFCTMTSRILVACLVIVFGTVACLGAPPKAQQPQPQPQPQTEKQDQPLEDSEIEPNYPAPEINWGKCPQLKPSDKDKEQKRQVIQKCLEQNPPPAYSTITDPKQIDDHREIVTTCALKTEGWFNEDGSYKFNRAKSEIESKKLDAEVEKNISKRHEECQDEAVKRYPAGYIQQVQLYQACMDYHIAEICEIELIPPPGGFPLDELVDYDDIPPQNPQNSASSSEESQEPAKKEEKKKEN